MPIKCEVCGGRVKSTQRLKRAIEADESYIIICTICRSNAKELLNDDYRCTNVRVGGDKCKAFRFSKKSDLCRYHWGKENA